jgi:hypothetical protein
MGVKQNTWSNIELGINPCSDRYINLVCLTYGVREEWLRTGKGSMLAENPKLPSKLIFDDSGTPLPPDMAELIAICQELMPLNRDAVFAYAETTLQAQRNTIKSMQDADADKS